LFSILEFKIFNATYRNLKCFLEPVQHSAISDGAVFEESMDGSAILGGNAGVRNFREYIFQNFYKIFF
jgi:hypothetical protein